MLLAVLRAALHLLPVLGSLTLLVPSLPTWSRTTLGALAAVLASLLALGWVRGPQPEFEDPPSSAEEQAGALLQATADALSGAADARFPALDGQWYVTVYSLDGTTRRSVAVAGADWAGHLSAAWPGRVQVDLAVPNPPPPRAGPGGMGLDIGLDGWLEDDGTVHVPVHFLFRGFSRGRLAEFIDTHPGQALRTWSWVMGEQGATRMLRASVDPGELTPPVLRERAVLAGDYLAQHVRGDGTFDYSWQSRRGKPGSGYNILRHAGATYTLFQVYGETGGEDHYAAALLALGYLERAREHATDGRCYQQAGNMVKTGAVGITLLALAEQARVAPADADWAWMHCLAEHIVSMTDEDGRVRSFSSEGGRYDDPGGQVAYYSGEALLALVQLYKLDPDPRWLDTAVRGADHLVHERWKALGLTIKISADAWLAQLLVELSFQVSDPAYVDHAFAVGTALRAWQFGPEAPVDFQGGRATNLFPQSIASGARLEGLAAIALLEAKERPGQTGVLDQAELTARFSLRHQYTEPVMLGLRRPERSLGGFRESADDGNIRIDGVQHNISGLLLLAQAMEQRP
jgi:hypothetical protein